MATGSNAQYLNTYEFPSQSPTVTSPAGSEADLPSEPSQRQAGQNPHRRYHDTNNDTPSTGNQTIRAKRYLLAALLLIAVLSLSGILVSHTSATALHKELAGLRAWRSNLERQWTLRPFLHEKEIDLDKCAR